MGLLKPAVNSTAFLKVGIMGFEGGGKTRTAVELAVGMTKLVKGEKVAFFDTEKGSDFHVKRFKEEGIGFDRIKSKAFIDLIDVMKEAERGGYTVLIIDSITHVYRELTEAWLKKRGRDRLSMQDWGALKKEWSQFTDLYVNSKLHIIMCGRAGHDYDMSEDEDGKMQVHKVGTKMKTEAETAFEPDLLIEMMRIKVSEETGDKNAKGFINRAFVLKDRTDTLNGQTFDKPNFETFLPVVRFLNIGGVHEGVTSNRSSVEMLGNPERSVSERLKQIDISLEKLSDLLTIAGLSGASADVKGKRTKLLVDTFGGSGETFLKNMRLEELNKGIEKIQFQLQPGLATKSPDPITAGDAVL